jgi:hypothetical protein
MAALLSALVGRSHTHTPVNDFINPHQLEHPEAFPPFLIDGAAPHPPFAHAICVAGFRPAGALADALFASPYTTRTVHVLGRTDVVVVEERARTLLDVSANKRVVWHDGGAHASRRCSHAGPADAAAQDTLCPRRRRGGASSARASSSLLRT